MISQGVRLTAAMRGDEWDANRLTPRQQLLREVWRVEHLCDWRPITAATAWWLPTIEHRGAAEKS